MERDLTRSVSPDASASQGTRARAERYETWPELQRAVLGWCRESIAKESPGFDCAALEADLQRWINHWATDNDEGYKHWFAFMQAFSRADAYLRDHPSAAERSLFAAMLEAAFGAACEGNDEGVPGTVRDRLKCWRLVEAHEVWPLGASPRARLVSAFVNAPANVLWWRDRTPRVRDLAIIALLAGQWPGAARKQQTDGSGSTRPTVMDVVGAEENAIRALLSARKRASATPV
jgi:hypothetical protein